jgi:glycyl-tRNA synthetase beta chain
MGQFLLEIGAEEIPAGFLGAAIESLATTLDQRLTEVRISHGEVRSGATPRRLTVWLEDLAERQADLEEVKSGPPVKIAYDSDGNLTKAATGFARGLGVPPEDLFELETPKGNYLAARVKEEGRPTRELLGELLPKLIAGLHFKKSMHWEPSGMTFARPIRWVCALLDGEVVDFTVGDVRSSNTTVGHRIMHPAAVEVSDVSSYLAALAGSHVVLQIEDRRQIVRARLAELAVEVGGRVVEDEGLVAEVANLVEFPWGAAGTFDRKNLELPREVLISSMRAHQRYFAFESDEGELLAAFGVFSNTVVRDPKVVVEGNERVLRARLHDAGFFFREDQRRRLEDRVSDLGRVTFLGELDARGYGGDVKSRTDRCVNLAGKIAALAYPDQPEIGDNARRAALLAKVDLTTLVVGEFPDLQGTIGMYYARLDGEPEAVSTAIGEHYRPRGPGEAPAASPAGRCVALADKLDLIASCFAADLIPSGNKDPYGLRRAALGVLATLASAELDLDLGTLVTAACQGVRGAGEDADGDVTKILGFLEARLRNDLTEDYRTDIVDAVLAAGSTRSLDARRRVAALAKVADEADLAPVGVAFKRINNILQKNAEALSGVGAFALEKTVEAEERELGRVAQQIRGAMKNQLETGDYAVALGNLLTLRAPLDDFFTKVMVMHEDPELRANRLALLRDLRQTFGSVADVSRIHIAKG